MMVKQAGKSVPSMLCSILPIAVLLLVLLVMSCFAEHIMIVQCFQNRLKGFFHSCKMQCDILLQHTSPTHVKNASYALIVLLC